MMKAMASTKVRGSRCIGAYIHAFLQPCKVTISDRKKTFNQAHPFMGELRRRACILILRRNLNGDDIKIKSMVKIRKINHDTGSGATARGRSARSPTLSERRKRWGDFLHTQHYQSVIEEVLERELPKYTGSNILPPSLSSIMRECIPILASASPVLLAAVDGTLTRRLLTDAELKREYAMIQERAHVQPSIYIHLLADDKGSAPTASQYLAIRETILQYLSSGSEYQEQAWQIDNISPPTVQRSASTTGYRKYLLTPGSSSRHKTLRRFCEGISQRVGEVPHTEREIPLPYPPSECGYSINSHVRIAQHRGRHSSNYVMNLVEDICAYLHQTGRFPQLFRMQPFIVYLIFRLQQAALAEIFCSGLLQVWIDEGSGLNAYPAGRSVASVGKVSKEQWAEHQRWVEENTELKRNVRVQMERLEEDVLGLPEGMEMAWREALGSEDEGDGDDPRDLDYVPDELPGEFEKLHLDYKL